MSRQLRTWKEIAQHLGVSVRTAQNWERERSLPIRRITGGEKPQVRALAGELDEWFSRMERPSTGVLLRPTSQDAAASAPSSPLLAIQPDLKIGHLGACCGVYSALFALDLFLEISYQYNRLGWTAVIAAPFVAAWITSSSALGLWVAWRRVVGGRRGGFTLSFTIFAATALLVFGTLALTSVLPREPITLLQFPSQPADIAYLKNVILYFLPLITAVWLIPFHFIACVHRQLRTYGTQGALELLEQRATSRQGMEALYIAPVWLVVGMFLMGFASVILTQDLIRNLLPGRYATLFMVLALSKSTAYFALGMLCVTWYARVLKELRDICAIT